MFLRVFVILAVLVSFSTAYASDAVLAKVGGKTITKEHLDRVLKFFSERGKMENLKEQASVRDAMLKRMVHTMVVAELARKKGIDKRPEVKAALELITNDNLERIYVTEEVINKINVTNDDIELYYKANKEKFTTPEQVKARQILISAPQNASDEEKAKAKVKAEAILKRAKTGEDFAKLASEVSEDPGSRTKGGDLGFFPKGKTVKPFEEAVFSMKPGEISGIVETQFGYHIIKLEERKEAGLMPLEKVKGQIKEQVFNIMKNQKVKEFIKKAQEDAGAVIYGEKQEETEKPGTKK